VRGEPEVYFGMDFLVEADIDAALQQTGEDAGTRQAVRRQADRIFEPFMNRVWVPAGGDRAADSPDLLEWLDRPYAPARGDVNLNPTRIGPLLDLFGGVSKFTEASRSAEITSRSELVRVSDLVTRCGEAQKRGTQAIAIQRAQAQGRPDDYRHGELPGGRPCCRSLPGLTAPEALTQGGRSIATSRLRCHGPCCAFSRFLSIVARANKAFPSPTRRVSPLACGPSGSNDLRVGPHAAVAFWRGSAALMLDGIFVRIHN
jgi:hypothetical protein